MSKRKTATNSRKGGGKKRGSNVSTAARSTSEPRNSRRTDSAQRANMAKNAKTTGPTPKEKRHAGLKRG
jgi:hypothetical protein